MTEVLLWVVIVMLGAVLILLWQRRRPSDANKFLKQDIEHLRDNIDKLRDGLTDRVTSSLDKNQQAMLESLQKQFAQNAKLVTNVTKDLTELKESNKRVVSITDELKTLQNILQNPKQRGVLGEYYLQTVLENVLPPERFVMQHSFADGTVVDAAIFLDQEKIIPIDSKFSLENYNRLVEEKDPKKRDELVKRFKADLKIRIDETSKYIKTDEGTLDHAFMFIPSEAIYYDLLINKVGSTNVGARDLIEYAFREKHVIIVSPTTFLAYLQTVLQGLRSLQIEQHAKEIQKQVGQLSRHNKVYQDLMIRLGKSLGTTVNHFNSAHKELGKLDKDVMKIAKTESTVDPMQIENTTVKELNK